MACGKGKAREKHGMPTRPSEVHALQHNHRSLLLIRAIKFIMGCDLVMILRIGELNALTRHPKDRIKNQSNLRTNSLQTRE
jgi:hypothetical protein